jgi:small subunit ribosomal protein S16
MLKIRLKRTGKTGQPHYRIVVIDSRRNRGSKAVAEIGYYNPRTQPTTFDIDKEAAKEWMKKGAQPTDTVAQYFVKEGLLKGLHKGSVQSKGAAKKKAPAATEEAAPAQS